MPTTSANALLIFIKNPEKGNVKTRLAATIGDENALRVYKKLVTYTRQTVEDLQADKQLWYSQFIPDNDEWDEQTFSKKIQEGESLGERMKTAFARAFDDGYERVVIIGSDCGQLEANHVEQAYEALQKNQVVIGPSQDGGYYLLGMNRFIPGLFEGKDWSTTKVFTQTLGDCKKDGLSVRVLEELNDVDTEADWEQVKDRF